MEIQISPASSFIGNSGNRLHASTSKSYEPNKKRFKSDLTFHCIVCSDVYDDPNVLYEHMKQKHPELYAGTENDEDGFDEEENNVEKDFLNCFDSEHELSDEELVDLSRLLEPICELRHDGDDEDEIVQNGSMLSNGNIGPSGTINPLLNQLSNEQQLRLQLQLQMQLQQHLQQLQQVNNLKQANSQLDVTLKTANGNVVRPLTLRKLKMNLSSLEYSKLNSIFFCFLFSSRTRSWSSTRSVNDKRANATTRIVPISVHSMRQLFYICR